MTIADLLLGPVLALCAPLDGESLPEMHPVACALLGAALVVLAGMVEGGGVSL